MSNDEIETVVTKQKVAVSKREVLNASGVAQDEWVDAMGFAYTSLAENFKLDVLFTDLPDPIVRALAAFGGLTLAGNVTNTIRNSKTTPVDATEKAALTEWLDNLKAGNWSSERGEVEAGVGALAEAYVRAQAKAGVTMDLDKVAAGLKAAAKELRDTIRKDPRVKAELAAITAERAAAKAASAPVIALPTF